MAIYNYITEQGVVVPDAGEILTGVQDEYKATFGQDLVVTPNTPQGLLIASETQARIAVASNNAELANQINPNVAGGIFLDAILALTGSFRNPATSTRVTATVAGVEGTIIPAGSLASETGSGDANQFQTIASVTIPVGGSLAGVIFESVETGPIPCATGTLTVIVSDVLGWETLSGSSAPVLGEETQSDIAARTQRLNTLALQGISLAQAMTSALFALEGVTSLTFLENIASTTQVIDGVTMVSHSLYLCINGGDNNAIAKSMTSTKSAGAGYNNGPGVHQSETIVVPFSGQSLTVLFDRPTVIPIYVQITVTVIIPLQDPITAIKTAITDYMAGNINNIEGVGVGDTVSPFELSGAVTAVYPGVFVNLCQISLSPSSGFQTTEMTFSKWEIASIPAGNIVVTIS